MSIRVLPAKVAARIAAGEVIERPASAVKELVENALDAGATRISVQIERGGLGLIRVSDDGRGIAPAELALALERHATSKLTDDADLALVTTLGFRGEALPSIAAAADLEIVSRQPEADGGAVVRVRDGAVGPVEPFGAAAGTTVTARELFARQPARRKFLRTPPAETGQVAQVVSHYALAYPDVAFSLTVDGRRSLGTAGSGDPREAVAAVYGAPVAAQLLDVTAVAGPFTIHGLIAPPELTRGARSFISIFVNRRWVQHRRLSFAAESAYEHMLMVGRHPIAIIDITCEPREVDVNVHPTKAEVRFRAEGEVFSAVREAVRAALVAAAPVPAIVSAVGGANGGAWWETATPTQKASQPLGFWRTPSPDLLPRPVEQPAAPATPREVLPALRVIGQVGTTYIIAEGPEGMYLIDQHAAHERVLFERIARARAARRPEIQGLLDPLAFEPTAVQAAVLADYLDALSDLGYELAPFGERAYLVRAVPALFAGRDAVRELAGLLDGITGDGMQVERPERVAATLACHAAVRAGKTLAPDEMRELVRLLEQAEAPRTCPHGRPTMVHVSAAALEREFGRR